MKHNYLKHLFTALLLLCTTVVTAHDFEVDGIFYNITDATNKTVEVTYKGNLTVGSYTGSVVIPESVTYFGMTYSVTSIGYQAFWGCTGLTSVEIPNSVTTIAYAAFYGCTGLTCIEIPNNLANIEIGAFCGCSGLTGIVIPGSVTDIGNLAFSGCSGLVSISVEAGNAKYDSRDNCNAIIETATNVLVAGCKNTEIPGSVTSIGNSAFSGCSGLTSVVIPNNVTNIGEGAFSGCSGLTCISVEAGNAKYDSRDNCNAIIETATNVMVAGCKNTEIPISVTSIGNSAFSDCTGLTSVVIPNNVTNIGEGAFNGCSGLTSIVIPNNVTNIGIYAFGGCSSLICVEIPNSVTSIRDYTFASCASLTSIKLPESLLSIGEYSFYDCPSLASMVIPEGVVSIEYDAFKDCFGLRTVINYSNLKIAKGSTQNGSIAYYADKVIDSPILIDGDLVWCDNDGTKTLAGYLGNATELTLPADYNGENYVIGKDAFNGCSNLVDIQIPGSITIIGEAAFEGTAWYNNQPDGLVYAGKVLYKYKGTMPDNASITIADGTLGIADAAFCDCTTLANVEISNSVMYIGVSAFSGCTKLKSVLIGKNVEHIGENAFSGCRNLKSITSLIPTEKLFATPELMSKRYYSNCTLYVSIGAKETYAATEGWSNFGEIVEMDFTGVEEVKAENGSVKAIYDLQGRRVDTLNKGLYIVDGKKIIIK